MQAYWLLGYGFSCSIRWVMMVMISNFALWISQSSWNITFILSWIGESVWDLKECAHGKLARLRFFLFSNIPLCERIYVSLCMYVRSFAHLFNIQRCGACEIFLCSQMEYITVILLKMNNYLHKSPDADHPIYHSLRIINVHVRLSFCVRSVERRYIFFFLVQTKVIPYFCYFCASSFSYRSLSLHKDSIDECEFTGKIVEQILRFCDQMNPKYWTFLISC